MNYRTIALFKDSLKVPSICRGRRRYHLL